MNKKKLMTAGLTFALMASPLFYQGADASANQQPNVIQVSSVNLTGDVVVNLAAQWAATASYIQIGGDYKEGEYKTFRYKGMTYRYLSSSIDTHKELYDYVRKTLTPKETVNWFKDNGIIEYKGKLAQPEADGGSLLVWEKAKVKYLKTEKKKRLYRLYVPIGDTKENEVYIIGIEKEKTKWKVGRIPYLD